MALEVEPMPPESVLRRLALPLSVAVLALGSAAAQGRKLNAPLASRYGADASAFVLAGERLVYVASGLDPLHYSTLLSTTIDGSAPSTTLFSDALPEQLTSTSDGARVVFRAGNANYGTAELFSVPADGSQPAIRLNPAFADGEDVYSFRLSQDGQRVVYEAVVAELNPFGAPVHRRRLFVAPVDGSHAATLLTPTLEFQEYNPGYVITSDSTRVVFTAVAPNDFAQLSSVSLSGDTAPVQLSPTLPLTNIMDFQLSPDGSRAVYLFAQYDYVLHAYFNDLVSVPVDGSAAGVRLNPQLPPNGSVLSFQISPDSSSVSYFADQTSAGAFALHSVPIVGGASLQLTPNQGANYNAPSISPDGAWVLYKTRSNFELFAVPADGSRPPVRLGGSYTQEFKITADSQHVVFAWGQSIYAAPIDASSPAVELLPPVANQFVRSVELLPGSGRVLFRVVLQTGPYYDTTYGQLYSAPVDGSAPAVRLDATPAAPLGNDRGVTAYAYDPRTNTAVYRGDETDAYFFELFRAPIDGSAAGVVKSDLRGSLQVYGDVSSFQVHPDGELAAYKARVEGGFGNDDPGVTYRVPLSGPPDPEPTPYGAFTPDWSYALYHVTNDIYDPKSGLVSEPTSGGPQHPLHPLPEFGNVLDERVTPDGTRVAYRYQNTHGPDSHLYVVPLDRSVEPVELTRWSAGRVNSFAISPDSTRAVFLGSASRGLAELHQAPTDGSAAPVVLHPPLVAGGAVVKFALSPDGQRVVYLADQDVDDVFELYSVPIGGGAVTRLNAPLVAGGDVGEFRLSPDSEWVVFLADMEADQAFELFRAPLDGGSAPLRLVPVPLGRQVLEFGLSPDSTRVVLRADLGAASVNELYSVSLTAPTSPICLNAPPVAGGDVDSFQITADGSRVVYVGDQDTDDTRELYSVPTDGRAAPVRLSVPLAAGRDVSTTTPFQLDRTGRWVLYDADADADEVYELFASPVDTPLPALRINGPLRSATPTTVIGRFSKHGVVYMAEEDALGATELYQYEGLGLRGVRSPRVRVR